jgi:hypothetical protein
MLFVLTVQEIGKIQPFGRICYIKRMLTFIWDINFTNVLSDYPKSRENRHFSEELYAPKVPNIQYVQISSLGYSKKDYVGFEDKYDRKTATERYQCLETSQWKAKTSRKSDERISRELITDDIGIALQAI